MILRACRYGVLVWCRGSSLGGAVLGDVAHLVAVVAAHVGVAALTTLSAGTAVT